MSSHSRRNDAHRYQEAYGGSHAEAMRQVHDQLPPARRATRAQQAPVWDGEAVPPQLLAANADLARWAIRHLNEVAALGDRLPHNLKEWARLVSYAITDAHAYTQIMAGTNAAFFQMHGMDPDTIRRNLQCPDPDRYVTPTAVAHAAGLVGRPLPPGAQSTTWWSIGRQYAGRSDGA